MASTIKVKRSAVQGKAPTAGNLETGEIALNTRDGRLYSKGTQIFEVGANTHSLFVGAGGVTFANGAYTFPTADGSANQILQTDGSGALSFVDNTGGAGGGVANSYLTSTFTTNTAFQSALANTNAYIATKVNSSNPTITGALSANGSVGTSGYVLKSAGAGNPVYWDVSSGGATIQTMPFFNSSGSLDTITISGSSFTFYDSTGTADSIDISTDINLNSLADVSVAAPSLNQVLRYNGTSWVSSDSAGASWSALTSTNTAIRTVVGQNLANTNAYIATKLDSSSYTTADVQSKASLANTNAYIASVQSDVDANEATERAALANTNAYIATKAPTASPTFTGTVTADAVDLSANNPRIRFDDSDTSNNGEIRLSNTALRIESDEDNAVASSLITFHIDAAEKMRIDSSGNVTTAGSITPGSYRAGEVIECLSGTCDGRTIVGLSGTYTWPDGTQHIPSTTYVDLNGSSLSYTPPAGTNHVKYEFNFQASYNATSPPLYHLRFYYDGTEVTHGRMSQYLYYDDRKNYVIALSLNNGTESIAAGEIGTWDSAKIIKLMVRAYTDSYRPDINSTHYFDGVSSRQHVRPTLTITAIA
jgi:hypothetical protein